MRDNTNNDINVKAKFAFCLIKHHPMKTYGEVMYSPSFLTSTLDEGEWLAQRPGRFIPREIAAGAH
jgi:hypothetical protein